MVASAVCRAAGTGDLELKTEFPGYEIVRKTPYTFVTRAGFERVEHLNRVLTGLRGEFQQKFSALIPHPVSESDIQVILFTSPDAFLEYTRRKAPAFIGSAGFFSAADARLVLLDHPGRLDSRGGPSAVSSRTLASLSTGAATERLIRHEAAHQLFHRAGMHSRYLVEPTWLLEGLAQYLESPNPVRRPVRDPLPLRDLINHRDAAGFFAMDRPTAETAYAMSEQLVVLLMQEKYRARFFRFIKSYRAIDSETGARIELHIEPFTRLMEHLRMDEETFEREWRMFAAASQ